MCLITMEFEFDFVVKRNILQNLLLLSKKISICEFFIYFWKAIFDDIFILWKGL